MYLQFMDNIAWISWEKQGNASKYFCATAEILRNCSPPPVKIRWWNKGGIHYCSYQNNSPWALAVIWVSETLHWRIVRSVHICITTAHILWYSDLIHQKLCPTCNYDLSRIAIFHIMLHLINQNLQKMKHCVFIAW